MTNDGTQDPAPPPLLADPLAGLVTSNDSDSDAVRVRVTEPAMPDISAVREAMASVLDENSELDLNAIGPAANFFAGSRGDAPPAAQAVAPPPGQPDTGAAPVARVPVTQVPTEVAGQAAPAPAHLELPVKVPTRGEVTRVSPPSDAVPVQRRARELPPAVTGGERTRRILLPRGFMRRRPKLPPGVRRHSSAGSVTLIMALLLVMVVLGIVFLASLISSIAGLFD